jgi:hypothetical protein
MRARSRPRLFAIDSVFRLAARQAIGWWLLLPAGFVISTLSQQGPVISPDIAVEQLLAGGLFCLIFACPQAAIRLLHLEREGRLDLLRLSALTPARLLAAWLGGGAAPWTLIGIALLAWLAWIWVPAAGMLPAVAAVVGDAVALSLLMLALQPSLGGVDDRIAQVGLVTVVLAVSALAGGFLRTASPGLGFKMSAMVAASAAIVVVEALLVALSLSGLRRFAVRPVDTRVGRPVGAGWATRIRPLVPVSARRGVTVFSVPAAVLVALLAAPIVALRWYEPAGAREMAFVMGFLPVAAAALVIWRSSRAEVESGRFDVERLAWSRPAAWLAICGLWAPFLIATAVLETVIALAFGVVPTADLVFGVIGLLAFVAPVVVIEGLNQAAMFTYSLPGGFAASQLVSDANGFPIRLLTVIWLPWYVVADAFRRGPARPLTPAMAYVATVAVTVALAWSGRAVAGGPSIVELESATTWAAVMLVLAAWTPHAHRAPPLDWRHRLALPALVFTVICGLMLSARGEAVELQGVALIGAIPAAALSIGVTLHVLLGRRPFASLAARVGTAAALMMWAVMWAPMLFAALPPAFGRDMYLLTAGTLAFGLTLATAIVLLAAAVALEAVCQATARRQLRALRG